MSFNDILNILVVVAVLWAFIDWRRKKKAKKVQKIVDGKRNEEILIEAARIIEEYKRSREIKKGLKDD